MRLEKFLHSLLHLPYFDVNFFRHCSPPHDY
jgi:hypothetical protein